MLKDDLGIRVINVTEGNSMSSALFTIRKNTSAKKIITLEAESNNELTLAVLSKIEKTSGPGGDIVFIKDQANLVRSMENSREDVYPDLSQTAYLTTIKINDPAYPQISKAQQRIDSIEFSDTLSNCTAELFYEYLINDDIKQLVVVIRANDDGLIFPDEFVSYEELKLWLEDLENPKDMIYIISNYATKIQHLISNSGKSTLTIASQFTIGEPESLASCLNILTEFYQRTHYTATIKINKWNSLVKQYPELEEIALKNAVREIFVPRSNEVVVPTGRFTQTEINRIPAKIWNKLVKATGLVNKQKMPAESRNIQSIINTLQLQKIEELRPRLQQNSLDHFNLKAIPHLKVEIRCEKNSSWC